MKLNSLVFALFWICTQFQPISAQDADVREQKPVVVESQVHKGGEYDKVLGETKEEPKGDGLTDDGPKASWIWPTRESKNGDRWYFFYEFEGGSSKAELFASCDNKMTVYLNGKRVASSNDWGRPVILDVQKHIKSGVNKVMVDGDNEGSVAGLILKLALQDKAGKVRYVLSGKDWKASRKADGSDLQSVIVHGEYGVGPWGNIKSSPKRSTTLLADIPRDVFMVQEGFQIEQLYKVPKGDHGSWVAITFDNKGRLIASDQGNKGLYRITPPVVGSDEVTKIEKLKTPYSSAQGLLYAFDSLYVSINGGIGSGLYRAQDTDGDDQFDTFSKLKEFRGGGEHGPHSLRLSPDGKSIYVIAGNHTDPPGSPDASRVPLNWSEDHLLPRQWDARGHARGKLAPGGWIAKTNPQGDHWEMVSIGYRNPYDFDIAPNGEMFAYDADMEWDMGTPWYRPTRVVHVTSGSEFGWRSGTGKWPSYYEDSLPAAVDIGPGSPVGVVFGTGTKFPTDYQKALYILDWTFGTIYSIHFTPNGSTYTAEKRQFVSRAPLPLTDVAVGPDGHMYFTIGGRGAESALYRVSYQGEQSTEAPNWDDDKYKQLRDLRHELEAFHGVQNPKAVPTAIRELGSEDRFIRYAARIALESQPVEQWATGVLALKDPVAVINGVIGIARQGGEKFQAQAIEKLSAIDIGELSKQGKLALLRAYALTFVRLGESSIPVKAEIASALEEHFPSGDNELDRELSRVLVYLDSPVVINEALRLMAEESEAGEINIPEYLSRNTGYGSTVANMLANSPELQKVHYALVLRNMKFGWTLEQRRQYFQWLADASAKSGGASYTGFLLNIQSEALANASEAERAALDSSVIAPPPKEEDLPKAEGPGKAWAVEDLVSLVDDGLVNRSFENGKKMFAAAKCGSCHRFAGNGGATGPDLSNLAGRFGHKELAEAIVVPSKVISDQYRAMQILTTDGNVITGRVTNESDGKITVLLDAVDATKVAELDEGDIDEMTPSKLSLMPEKLLDKLNKEEVLDLLAFLLSRGNSESPMFTKN